MASEQVTRYDWSPRGMEDDEAGQYVHDSDYATLLARCEQAEARVEELQTTIDARIAERIRELEATVAACKAAGFVDEGGKPTHIPKHSKPSRADVANLHDYIEWHGPQHLNACPEDDTCDCGGRPINESVNRCLLFLMHFTGGQPRTAAEAARGGEQNA